jgi:hypothetical protein
VSKVRSVNPAGLTFLFGEDYGLICWWMLTLLYLSKALLTSLLIKRHTALENFSPSSS